MQASVLPFVWPIGKILEHQPNLLYYVFMELQFNKLRFPGLSHAAVINRTYKLGFSEKKDKLSTNKTRMSLTGLICWIQFSSRDHRMAFFLALVLDFFFIVHLQFSHWHYKF